MKKQSIPQEVEEKLKEFRDEIYGESDALFDRAGNNISTQVESWLTQALLSVYNSGKEAGKVQLTQTLQGRTDLGYEYLNGLENALSAPSSEDNK